MIDSTPSLQLAKELTAPALAAYLVITGWKARSSRVDGISILSKKVPGSDDAAEFILPVVSGFSDEQRRIADALRTVSAVENMTMPEIVSAVFGLQHGRTEEIARQEAPTTIGFEPLDEPNIDAPKSSRAFFKKGRPVVVRPGRGKTGTVKFFNPEKGFGFIVQDGGGPDVFVHISAVERAGMKTLVEGQKIVFEVEADPRSGDIAASIMNKPA